MLGWDLRIFISNKFPGKAEATGPGTTFWDGITTLHLYIVIYNVQGTLRYIKMMYLYKVLHYIIGILYYYMRNNTNNNSCYKVIEFTTFPGTMQSTSFFIKAPINS